MSWLHVAGRAELVSRIEVLDERCSRYQALLEECRALLGPQWPQVELVDVPGRLRTHLAELVVKELSAERDRLREELRDTRRALRNIVDSHRVERLFRELARAGREQYFNDCWAENALRVDRLLRGEP